MKFGIQSTFATYNSISCYFCHFFCVADQGSITSTVFMRTRLHTNTEKDAALYIGALLFSLAWLSTCLMGLRSFLSSSLAQHKLSSLSFFGWSVIFHALIQSIEPKEVTVPYWSSISDSILWMDKLPNATKRDTSGSVPEARSRIPEGHQRQQYLLADSSYNQRQHASHPT